MPLFEYLCLRDLSLPKEYTTVLPERSERWRLEEKASIPVEPQPKDSSKKEGWGGRGQFYN